MISVQGTSIDKHMAAPFMVIVVVPSPGKAGLNYGAGVGFVWSNKSRKSLGLTFRLLYIRGKNLTYVLPDSFTIDSTGAMGYVTDTANTSYFAIQLGISMVTIRQILRTP